MLPRSPNTSRVACLNTPPMNPLFVHEIKADDKGSMQHTWYTPGHTKRLLAHCLQALWSRSAISTGLPAVCCYHLTMHLAICQCLGNCGRTRRALDVPAEGRGQGEPTAAESQIGKFVRKLPLIRRSLHIITGTMKLHGPYLKNITALRRQQ